MKNDQRAYSTLRKLSALALAAGLVLPLVSRAASVTLATSPLATSTTSTVSPNVVFLLDNSGSMGWDHMPDNNTDGGSAVSFNFGYYGVRSSQCNQVYYEPSITYLTPVDAAGTPYADSSFTAACDDGFSGSCSVNLDSGFRANQSGLGGNAGGQDSSGPAYYYHYSGSQTTDLQRNYNNTSNTFYSECHSAQYASPGKDVFTRISLSDSAAATTATIVISGSNSTSVSSVKVNGVELMAAASASTTSSSTLAADIAAQIHANFAITGYDATSSSSTVTITGLPDTANSLIVTQSGSMALSRTIFPKSDATQLTNFANWYSFYRKRLLMMKTAAGRAFKTLDNHYRVGFIRLSTDSSPTEYVDTFSGTQRSNWYSSLYATTANNSTPLREALAYAGRYFAGKLSGADPIQYSCQQNFTILSTDGFWNGNRGFQVNSSGGVGNQDGDKDRPQYDGANQTETSTQITQSQTQCSQQTSTLIGTLSQVLMRCNSTAAVCGTAPADGLPDANWSVVTSGSCTVSTNTQCSAVNVTPSITSAVATQCNTGASISTATLPYTLTITVTGVSSPTQVSSLKIDGNEILTGTTWSWNNDTNSLLATRIEHKIDNGTSKHPKYISSVSGNVITITYPGVITGTSSLTSYNLSSGAATLTSTISGGGYTYTLNNADSNGYIYSSCAYSAWSTAALAESCSTVTQSNQPNNTSVTTASKYTTNTVQGNTLVASCTPSNTGAPDYIQTNCTPLVTVKNNVATCTPQSASSANNYTSISCTGGTTGGTSDTLADVAMYYYQNDLRTSALGNCTGAMGSGVDVCPNNVFRTDTDSNNAQHMATFTLGMGASGLMQYSPTYLTDTIGDYYSVWKGITARPNVGPMVISISGTAATSVTSIKVGGTELMSAATPGEVDAATLAGDIAAKITQNGYTATANSSTVTITPTPASIPVISKAGDMIFSVGPVCSWGIDNTPCNWPTPGMDNNGNGYISNIDDLWHAAVDGHGQYFSATSPTSLSAGLSNALASIASRKGSSAAAATSTLNPVAGNNYAYVASYTTVKWQGNLEARTIDVNTGVISATASWCVESIVSGTCPSPSIIVSKTSGSSTNYYCQTPGSACPSSQYDSSSNTCNVPMATSCTGTMPAMVSTNSDTRNIYTANSSATALTPFDAAYATANPAYFSATGLSQWSSFTATQQAEASGTNLINFLRGQSGYENRTSNLVGSVDNRLYRYREATMGDALESQPIFIAAPVFSYADPGYTAFKTAQASRPGTVYMGANDGMLHAFSALDEGTSPVVPGGSERWAYVPSMVIPNMWKLADYNYATQHTNFVNGSPIISDICTAFCDGISGTPVWKTILVGGLNAGGRGYYALDITDPTAPALLWEFTTTAGQGSVTDDDLGYSYGNPVITAKADGTWVVLVTSGYNNTSPGNGQGYLYVLNAATGAIISKIGTGAGSTTTPSGLAKISAWNDSSASNRASYVYGGDLLGNVWRFDINSTAAVTTGLGTGDVVQFATLKDPSGVAQPITTSPVLGQISKQRVIFVGTGKYLETSDLTDTQVQSEYALKDDGTTIYTNPAGSPRNSTTLVQQTLTTSATGNRSASTNPVDFTTGHGWYVDFPDSGERSNIESKLVQGTLLVATIVPSNTVCSPGGYGWLNFFDYKTGSSIDASGIVSVSYDNSIVGINVLYINGSPVVEAVTSNNPTPTVNTDVLIKPPPSGFTGVRLMWRELNQ